MCFDQDDLARRLIDGDDSVFKELRIDVWPIVRRSLERRSAGGLSRDDEDDLLQEALLVVWENRHKYDANRASVPSWFCGIVRNAARELLRRNWVQERRHETAVDREQLEAAMQPEADQRDDRAGANDEREKLALLRECLGQMSERERAILFACHACNGHRPSSEELAKELGYPSAAAARKELSRATAKIVDAFQKAGLRQPDESDASARGGGANSRNSATRCHTQVNILIVARRFVRA